MAYEFYFFVLKKLPGICKRLTNGRNVERFFKIQNRNIMQKNILDDGEINDDKKKNKNGKHLLDISANLIWIYLSTNQTILLVGGGGEYSKKRKRKTRTFFLQWYFSKDKPAKKKRTNERQWSTREENKRTSTHTIHIACGAMVFFFFLVMRWWWTNIKKRKWWNEKRKTPSSSSSQSSSWSSWRVSWWDETRKTIIILVHMCIIHIHTIYANKNQTKKKPNRTNQPTNQTSIHPYTIHTKILVFTHTLSFAVVIVIVVFVYSFVVVVVTFFLIIWWCFLPTRTTNNEERTNERRSKKWDENDALKNHWTKQRKKKCEMK